MSEMRRGIKHQPALPYQQIHAFVQALRAKNGISPKAFEFLILTAGRSGEVLGAKWDEIDLASKVWTIPADRMKAGREHRIPLSERAVTIIQEMLAGRQCDFVFPEPKKPRLIVNDTTYQALGEILAANPKRGRDHWNYRGAGQTQAERQERQAMSVFFHEAEELMFRHDMMAPGSTRTRGRKPNSVTTTKTENGTASLLAGS